MPNYEELYYTARNKYNEAVEERNYINSRRSELNSERQSLIGQINQKNSSVRRGRNEVDILRKLEAKCREILEQEFSRMQSSVEELSREYRAAISSDMGVADISGIYGEDIARTRQDLEQALSEFEQARKRAEEQLAADEQALNNAQGSLEEVRGQLSSCGNPYIVQNKINTYYAQMKEYKTKWENGM